MSALEPVVTTIAASSFVPGHFMDKATGQPRLVDLRYAVEWLSRKGLDPLTNIDQVYVANGRIQAMAELQRVLARRAGFDLEVVSSTNEEATVRIRRLGGWMAPDAHPWHEVTVTMQQARLAKWPERNPSYGLMPDRMLVARACTRAISLYAPEASRLIETREGGQQPTTELASPPDPMKGDCDERGATPHTVRRDEYAVSPERLDQLERDIRAMSDADRESLRHMAKAVNMPNLRSAAFTLRDASLLWHWINDLDPGRPFTEDDDDE